MAARRLADRMSEKTMRVAVYCRTPKGRTRMEILTHFNLSSDATHKVMRTIMNSPLITIGFRDGVYRVTNIISPSSVKLYARSISTGEVISFDTAYEAEKIGGFNAGRIRQCLVHGWSHGGFMWFTDAVEALTREHIEPLIMRQGVTIDECAEKYDTTPRKICQLMGWEE